MRRVLVLEDRKEVMDLLNQALSSHGFSLQFSPDAPSALHRLKAWKPQIVLLRHHSADPLDGDLASLITKIRSHCQDEYAAIIALLSDKKTSDDTMRALAAGADDVLRVNSLPDEITLRARVMVRFKEIQDALKRANQKVDDLASRDELTGAWNMRFLYKMIEDERVRSMRSSKPISGIALSIDSFQTIQKEAGYLSACLLLQQTAARLMPCLRSQDKMARVGGEEFFIFLPETALADAEFTAERMRDSVSSVPYKLEKSTIRLTVSAGVSHRLPSPDGKSQMTSESLLQNSLEAMRSAQTHGGNRVESYSFA